MEPWQISVLLGISFLLFIARVWLKSAIEKSASHIFDVRIEKVRADFREREELLRSAIRSRESDIASLRSAVLDGRSTRISWLEKRRLEALERIWGAVVGLGAFKAITGMMAVIKFEEASKEATKNASLRQMISVFTGLVPQKIPDEISVEKERPYVSPILWAYFAAYRAIFMGAYVKAKALEVGLSEPSKFLNLDHVTTLINAVLPHHAQLLEKFGDSAQYYLIDEIETLLLKRLKEEFEGVEVDQVMLLQAQEIMQAVKNVTASQPGE
ncbi:MAG: hypothetical protein C6Y20_10850 [Tagaea sp. CACIAM 22H2]|nr:hypothetical protein [Tagaea sp. CACIAM 22H2]